MLHADEPPPDFAKTGRPFLEKYCIGCHSGKEPKAELSLEPYRDAVGVVRAARHAPPDATPLARRGGGKVADRADARGAGPFLRCAFRRPPTADELERSIKLAERAITNGEKWEGGIQLAMQAALCSPKFLFRIETDEAPTSSEVRPLTEFQLASRLSYFLWNEYFSAIRDIELRIERAEKLPPIKAPDYPAPTVVPAVYEEHIRLMCDLIVLAFQADVTRIVTFVLANEASNKPYPFIQVPEGHHDLSHHGGDAAKQAKIRLINLFHTKQLAHLLGRMNAIREGDGTLLDHAMIAYGSGIQDGNAHNNEDLPMLLAGGGCGTLSSGRHLRSKQEVPLSNLWLSMLNRMDITVEKLGDSSGALASLYDPSAKPPPKPMANTVGLPKPIMCKPGELLMEDDFDSGKYGKQWSRITGKVEVSGGQLKCAEVPADMHHLELSAALKGQDFVIQFSFKLDGAKMLAIGLENPKGHLARAIATGEASRS